MVCRPQGVQGLDELQVGVDLQVVWAARRGRSVARKERPEQPLVVQVQQAPAALRLACAYVQASLIHIRPRLKGHHASMPSGIKAVLTDHSRLTIADKTGEHAARRENCTIELAGGWRQEAAVGSLQRALAVSADRLQAGQSALSQGLPRFVACSPLPLLALHPQRPQLHTSSLSCQITALHKEQVYAAVPQVPCFVCVGAG